MLFLIIAIVSNGWSQDCSTIRTQAADLENALSENNPKSYYDFAKFIGSQYAADNGCLNKKVLTSIADVLYDGYVLGDLRCGVRLAMIYEYGLYNYPTNHSKASRYANGILHVAAEVYESDPALYKEFGWVSPTLYLKNFNAKGADDTEKERSKLAFALLKEIQPHPVSDQDYGSFVRAKNDYHDIVINAILSGSFGEEKNALEAIRYAYRQSKNEGNGRLREYLEDNPNDPIFDNPAALLFFVAQTGGEYANNTDGILFYSSLYQKHIKDIKNLADYERSYALVSDEFKSILDNNFPNCITEKQKWDFVNESKLKEPDGYKGWKFLPEDEQKSLYRKAIQEESPLDIKERFQIFKAMVNSGDNTAIFSLVEAYSKGLGVVKNPQKAISLLEQASQMSDLKEEASFELALIYDKGLGLDPNWTKAANYYKVAASEYEEANEALGEFYTFGIGGLPQDIAKAKQYFETAIEYGSTTAEIKLDVLKVANEFPKEANYSDWKLKLEDPSQYGIRVIPYGEKLDVTISYTVEENSANNYVQLFPNKSQKFAIQYGSYSPCGSLTGSGKHELYVYHKSFNDRRQLGLFYITATDKDGANIALMIPMAVCFLPK